MADEEATKPTGDVRMEDNKREYREIEIEVAKNLLAKGYEWIARDKHDAICAYGSKPVKGKTIWVNGGDWWLLMPSFCREAIPLFESIRWEDDEPVRLRDIVPQILTDEEREWLRTVVKPFRDRLKAVEAYDGVFYGRYVMFATVHPEKWRDDIGEDMEHTLLPVPKDWFKGMEDDKRYTPKELGL